jgi:hypothetical protein
MSAPTPPQSSSSSDIDDNVSTAPSSLSPSSSAPSSIGPSSPKVSHDALKPESLGYELPVSQRSKEEYEVYEVPAYHESYPPLPEKKILDGPSTVGVPDDWVLRDSRMVHLTGKVSFTAIPPSRGKVNMIRYGSLIISNTPFFRFPSDDDLGFLYPRPILLTIEYTSLLFSYSIPTTSKLPCPTSSPLASSLRTSSSTFEPMGPLLESIRTSLTRGKSRLEGELLFLS